MGYEKNKKQTSRKLDLVRYVEPIPAGYGIVNDAKAFWDELCADDTKPPSISRTLGDVDTGSVSSVGETQEISTNVVEDTIAENTPKATWSSLFKDNRKHESRLTPQAVDYLDGEICIEEEIDDLDDWGFCLIGYFASKFPGKLALDLICKSWGVKYELTRHRSGWIVFKFDEVKDRDKVLFDEPYFIYGKQLILKVMPDLFHFDNNEFAKMPIWVNLYGLPLECWNAKVLSKITSRVGKPIRTDKLTATKGRITYARVLVEVDVSCELVRMVKITLPNGVSMDQRIVYEYEPKFCSCCQMFWHTSQGCRLSKPHEADPKNNKGSLPLSKAVGTDKQGQISGDGNQGWLNGNKQAENPTEAKAMQAATKLDKTNQVTCREPQAAAVKQELGNKDNSVQKLDKAKPAVVLKQGQKYGNEGPGTGTVDNRQAATKSKQNRDAQPQQVVGKDAKQGLKHVTPVQLDVQTSLAHGKQGVNLVMQPNLNILQTSAGSSAQQATQRKLKETVHEHPKKPRGRRKADK